MKIISSLIAVLLPFISVGAQNAAVVHPRAIVGMVHDAMARSPMPGAVVQAVLLDSAWAPVMTVKGDMATFSTVADSAGRYRLMSIPRGRFAIGFQHSALFAYGIEAPVKVVELSADSDLVVNLGVPPPTGLLPLICTNAPAGDDGAVVGVVLRDQDDQPLSGARAVVAWSEVAIGRGTLKEMPRNRTTVTSDDGTYRFCDLPSSTPLRVSVARDGLRSVHGDVTLPPSAAARFDFHLSGGLVEESTASIRGRVLDSLGNALAASVSVPMLERTIGTEGGAFVIPGVAAGTWMLEVRAIGYSPVTLAARAVERNTGALRITLHKLVQQLDTIRVTAREARNLATLEAVRLRAATSAGTMFLPGNAWLAGAMEPSDVFRAARGFSYKGSGRLETRQYVSSDGRMFPCVTTPNLTMRGSDRKEIVVYLDGARYYAGLEALNTELKVDQILAIEAYPDVISAPAIWRNGFTCGVIAVWTKR